MGLAIGAALFLIIGLYGLNQAEERFVANVAGQLASMADLESARVEQQLQFQADVVRGAAAGSRIQLAANDVAAGVPDGTVALRRALQVFVAGSPQYLAASVVRDGEVVASTSQNPSLAVAEFVPPSGLAVFGHPYVGADGIGRLPIAASLSTPTDPYAYQVVVDYDLRVIDRLVANYERVGDTWESHLAFANDDGTATFLTRLRFDQGAAFARTATESSYPAMLAAIEGVETVVTGSTDYRDVPSLMALRTIDPVGWGLIVKVDQAEAVAGFDTIRDWWLLATLLGLAVLIATVLVALGNLNRRLLRFHRAATAVQQGDFSHRINDPHSDELGLVAAEFDRAADVMAQTIEDKTRFVATVSHELRTPLAAVIGLSDVLASQDVLLTEEDKRSMAREIASQSNELGALVEDLLVVASARNGSLHVESVVIQIDGIVETLVDQLPSDVAAKLDVEVRPGLYARADAKRTRQILRNLITNAHKYGGPHIRVVAETGGDRISLQVMDNGSGVRPGTEHRIFGAFERGAHASTESVGLGLNIARELAQRMHGDLAYQRRDGWTVFTLSLPAVSEPVLKVPATA